MDYEYDEATDRLVAPSFWTPEAIALFEARHADWVAQRQAVERRMAEIAGPDYEMLPHLGDVRRLATGYLPAEDQGDTGDRARMKKGPPRSRSGSVGAFVMFRP